VTIPDGAMETQPKKFFTDYAMMIFNFKLHMWRTTVVAWHGSQIYGAQPFLRWRHGPLPNDFFTNGAMEILIFNFTLGGSPLGRSLDCKSMEPNCFRDGAMDPS
jgi:hypothetical protein